MKYLTLIILLMPSVILAFETGYDLKKICVERKEAEMELVCHTYIEGVLEGISLGARVTSFDITGEYVNYKLFCLPKDGTIGQYVEVIKKYIEDHPENLNEPSAPLISLAIKEAFPCK
jgi:hypothetical protein